MRALPLAGLLFAFAAHADDKLQVLGAQFPDVPAWGTNTAHLQVRNADTRSRDVQISWQSRSIMVGRNWGLDTSETIPAGETRTVAVEFIVPAFPGKAVFQLRVHDAVGDAALWQREVTFDFPFANSRAN